MFKRVYVEITNVCNLSCVFCPGTTREKRFLSPEEFRLMAEKLRDHTRYLYFHVMGEPLLHPQLAELLAIAGELGFRVCITTNGTLLSKKSSTLLSAPALHKVSVSLHSFEGNDGGDICTTCGNSAPLLAQRVCCAPCDCGMRAAQRPEMAKLSAFYPP